MFMETNNTLDALHTEIEQMVLTEMPDAKVTTFLVGRSTRIHVEHWSFDGGSLELSKHEFYGVFG